MEITQNRSSGKTVDLSVDIFGTILQKVSSMDNSIYSLTADKVYVDKEQDK